VITDRGLGNRDDKSRATLALPSSCACEARTFDDRPKLWQASLAGILMIARSHGRFTMKTHGFHCIALALLLAATLQLQGCSEKQPPAASVAPPAEQPAAQPADATSVPPDTAKPDAAQVAWSAESLEELLAPVALYPDPVLAQVLATSTNPQEVLDAGNWLLQNQDLKGKQLEAAATTAGFTPPMIALVQFPTVVDMMCMEMDWTNEVGSAFQADEPAVLDAVQRLRKQAADMGNLKSSEQMTVATEKVNNTEVIIVEPAKPEVVYVPQYDPAAVYTTPAPAPVATTTTTGYSTGTLVTTGLLAFGAGILVNEMFDDDDDHDHDDYYYPRWGYGYGGGGYYPRPYRPVYGGGFRPAHGYNRPGNYQHGFNNNNVFINTGGNDYWSKNRFDSDRKNNYRREARSPISEARPSRPELQQLNQRARPATTAAARPQAGDWKGKKTYEGAKAGNRDKAALARPADSRVAKAAPSGSYAGAKERPANRQATQQQRPAAKARPQTGGARDRGRESVARSAPSAAKATRPAGSAAGARTAPKRSNAFEGSRGSGKAERAASQRGKASMSKGSRQPAKAQGNRGGNRGKRG
jgi:hypothetical protein